MSQIETVSSRREKYIGIVLKVLGTISITLITIIGSPLASNYFQKSEDPNPIKMQYTEVGPLDPFILSNPKWMKIPQKYKQPLYQLKAIRTVEYTFENTGNVAIDEKNTKQPLEISVDNPWIFEDIFIGSCKRCINASWEKIDNHTYRIKTALINPGDAFIINLAMSDPGHGFQETIPSPKINMTYRVEGMKSLENKEIFIENRNKISLQREWGLSSYQTGWGLIFCLSYIPIMYAIFSFLYQKLYPDGFGLYLNTLNYSIYAVICVCSAEGTATLMIPSPYYVFVRPPLLENLMPIILNACIMAWLVCLYILMRTGACDKKEQPASDTV